MKNKKHILLIACMLLLGISTIAQETEATSFGIKAGINLQNINGKDADNKSLNNDLVLRFHAGVQANIPVAPEFYFQPGLLYNSKGAKTKSLLNSNAEFTINYLELPLSFLYRPLLGTGHLLLGFGPYVAYGLNGKTDINVVGITGKRDIKFANEYTGILPYGEYFKRMDYGANIFFGYELQGGLFIQLETQLGLAKINAKNTTNPNADTSLKNTGFGLSIGYMF
ncbi:MAG: outer membrane beta-barrel protein [Methylococcaceae bacterium]|nr:outer membrane beta-barrel protein [Prolixibacteraceae bacterium]